MRIRFARDQDYAEIARLHRQTIRNINSQDYPEDIIDICLDEPALSVFEKVLIYASDGWLSKKDRL